MPELPEVETILNASKPYLDGLHISEIITNRTNMRIPFPENLKEINNVRILKTYRRAKYMVWSLENGMSIILHLGMSGKLNLYDKIDQQKKHDHILFIINQSHVLALNDPRRFGLVTISQTKDISSHKLFANLGIEPLDQKFNVNYLLEACRNKSKPIKNLIMDNNIVVGVGNIYACESLFRVGIKPDRPSNLLNEQETKSLTNTIKQVLIEAIKAGGSTIQDYKNLSGNSGYFQHSFKVYGQKKCHACSEEIMKITQAGRSSFYCPICQN